MLFSAVGWRKPRLVSLLFVSLLLFFSVLSGSALSSEVMLGWVPNSEANLAGYKIHYGNRLLGLHNRR